MPDDLYLSGGSLISGDPGNAFTGVDPEGEPTPTFEPAPRPDFRGASTIWEIQGESVTNFEADIEDIQEQADVNRRGVRSVRRIGQGRPNGERGANPGEHTFNIAFRVTTWLPTDEADIVLYGGVLLGLPFPGSFFSEYGGFDSDPAVCIRTQANKVDGDEVKWIVIATFTTDFPLDQAPDIQWEDERVQRFVNADLDGAAIANSYGTMFEPLAKDDSMWRLRITINQPRFDRARIDEFRQTVNDRPVWGFDTGEVRFTRASGRTQVKNGITYWTVTYEFIIMTGIGGAEYIRLVDQGQEYLDVEDNPTTDRDSKGQRTGKKVPLDGNAHLGDVSDITYRTFRIYPRSTWVARIVAPVGGLPLTVEG